MLILSFVKHAQAIIFTYPLVKRTKIIFCDKIYQSMHIKIILLALILSACFPLTTKTVGMTSENFKLFADVVSVGGETPTSTNYIVFETTGEAGSASQTRTTSTNYIMSAGFQAMGITTLSASLSASTIALGSLSTTAVASGSQILTVNTSSPTGYTATIQEDGNLRSGANDINDVSDSSVTAGSEEYGIRTSGVAGQMNSVDTAITAVAQTIASTSTVAHNEATTITYKAAISAATEAGSYSQIITFTTTANY